MNNTKSLLINNLNEVIRWGEFSPSKKILGEVARQAQINDPNFYSDVINGDITIEALLVLWATGDDGDILRKKINKKLQKAALQIASEFEAEVWDAYEFQNDLIEQKISVWNILAETIK